MIFEKKGTKKNTDKQKKGRPRMPKEPPMPFMPWPFYLFF